MKAKFFFIALLFSIPLLTVSCSKKNTVEAIEPIDANIRNNYICTFGPGKTIQAHNTTKMTAISMNSEVHP